MQGTRFQKVISCREFQPPRASWRLPLFPRALTLLGREIRLLSKMLKLRDVRWQWDMPVTDWVGKMWRRLGSREFWHVSRSPSVLEGRLWVWISQRFCPSLFLIVYNTCQNVKIAHLSFSWISLSLYCASEQPKARNLLYFVFFHWHKPQLTAAVKDKPASHFFS